MKRRSLVYAGLLSAALAALGINMVVVHALEGELQQIADAKIAEFRADEPEETVARMTIGASVVATKRYLLFGEVSGKVQVFLRHDDGSGDPVIEGFEFFFSRDAEGAWMQTESGRCTSEQCTQEGLRVLRKLDAT